MKTVAVYGSLKRGFYNHEGLGEDANFLGTDTVSGVMHLRGSYPTLTAWEDLPDDEKKMERDHIIEVYEISDEAFEGIEAMEHGAGYVTELLNTRYGTAHIYMMPAGNLRQSDKWIEAYTPEVLSAAYNY